MTTLVGGRLVGHQQPVNLTIDQGRIVDMSGAPGQPGIPPARIDLDGLLLAPGLIDLQINGGFGEDFTEDPSSIWRVGARLPEHGVTAFLPTIISSPGGTVDRALQTLRARPAGYRGAEPLGLHLEGPMLSPARPGVHDTAQLRTPSLGLIDGWSPAAGVRMVTMAPELPGAEAVIRALRAAGVVVAAGHTSADYDQARAAFAWGVTCVTHLFNAMEPFASRAPGLIGALVEDPGVVAGLIADGVHSHPATVGAAWKWLRPTRMALVTDAMAAAGIGDGTYELGGMTVTVEDGRPVDASGRLAGSTLTLDRAVRNLVEFTACPPAEAVAAAATVPAAVLGLSERGRLAIGARADLTVFDGSMRVQATVIDGEVVWQP
ncbi:MAG TPA: N-acetylglucosamine-6-phosphate deacetylase [Acidimicrobiia bacterium]|nr:N-acetylglucosamine-6-phosphate deacetylase [Acidimicrobiia bacterium]